MAEGEASHHRKKEEYRQEVLQQLQINEAEARRRIQQAQQEAQQEARQYVGSVVNYAEQAHTNKLEENPKQNRQRNEQKKQKHQNIILFIKMSEHQIIEQSQGREQELHQRKALANYRHFPLENQHLEVNINQNMIILNRNTSLKEKQVDHQLLKDHSQKKKQKLQVLDKKPSQKKQTQSTTPTHGTKKDENKSRSYWGKVKTNTYFVDQLNLRKWEYPRTRNGRPKVLSILQIRQILFEINPSINQS